MAPSGNVSGNVSGSDLDLRGYARVLWRHKLLITLAVALVVGGAMAFTLTRTPIYRASAKLLVQPSLTESLFDRTLGFRPDAARALRNEILVLRSKPVTAAVAGVLGTAPGVDATASTDTDVITISADSADPERAAEVANTYARAYIEVRLNQTVSELLAATGEIEATIDELDTLITQIEARIAAAPLAEQAARREQARPELASLTEQQALFRQKVRELSVDTALKTGGAQLVTEATAPGVPVSPRPIQNAGLAAVVGLVLGIGLALMREFLDDSIKTKDDLERVVPGLPVLGLIPVVAGWRRSDRAHLAAVHEPSSPAAEAYRTLRTSVQFLAVDRPTGVIQITSAGPGEGKTTTLANLAVTLARAGYRVVVVCCDLRRPRVHEFFGLENAVGLTSVLLGQLPLARAVQTVPGLDRLHVLASGPLPPNPSELLASRRTAEVLSQLRAAGYIVLVDSPPLLPVTDGLVLAKRMDAVLLVAVSGLTTRKEATRSVELLQQVGAPLVGTVLNGVTADATYGYYYASERTTRAPAPQARSAR